MLDPEIAALIGRYPTFDPEASDVVAVREMRAVSIPVVTGNQGGVSVEEYWIGEGEQSLRVLIYRPLDYSGLMPALLHMHGGGYILGVPEICHTDNYSRALIARCVVVSVDYPLAPDAPYPAPIEACYRALQWLVHSAETLRVDTTRIAVGGESAGGGLAAALALMARERGEIAPLFQLLIYPMIDDRTGRSLDADNSEYAIWSAKANRFGWRSMLGDLAETGEVPAFAAAARCVDLVGLPPAFIAVGSLDLFMREDVDYAMRLLAAGVPTELQVFAGGCHGFDALGDTRIGRRLKSSSLGALRRALWPDE